MRDLAASPGHYELFFLGLTKAGAANCVKDWSQMVRYCGAIKLLAV